MDKSWMMIKHRWSSNEYRQGVESFLKFAKANSGSQTGVRCPCIDCLNSKTLSIEVVWIHLIRRGIDCSYKTWVHHGELVPAHQPQTQDDDHHEHNEDVRDQNDSCSFSNCIMASGSKSSISSNMDARSHGIAATPTEEHTLQPDSTSTAPSPSTCTSAAEEHTLQPDSTSTAPSPSTCTSAADVSTARQRRVRGPTLGKRTRSIIESKGGERLHVYVTEEMGALCGEHATKAANELGSQIRRMCPALGFHHTWKLVPPGLKSAILQAFRDKFKVTESDVENTPLVEKVLQKKASKVYAGWKNDMSTHYAQLKEAGKDPYQHPYQSISLEGWKFMIDNIFSDRKWQERSKAAKEKRNTPVDGYTVRSRLHTMGSKSYPAAITTEADKPNGKLPDFLERYKEAKTLKDGFWIDPLCEELYDQMVAMQVEAELSGRSPPTDEEYSRSVMGKTDYHLRGPCVDPRPSSFSSKSCLSSQQLLEVQSNLESLREERRQEREEDERRHQEAVVARYEAFQREQIRRDEEARMRNAALERQLSELRALVMGKLHGQDNGGSRC